MTERRIYDELCQIRETYRVMEEQLRKSLEKAPVERIEIRKNGKRDYYTKQYKNDKGKFVQEYISKKDKKLIKPLAQKKYDLLIEKQIKTNLKILEKFVKEYKLDYLKEGYQKIGELKNYSINLYQTNPLYILEEWLNEDVVENIYNMESKIFLTERKELVRSKSEVIIANALNQFSDKLLYKYERPLEMDLNGYKKKIYPDFTTLYLETGELSYWEHFGMMDNPEYAEQFVKKINLYENNGIFLGRDLFVTLESMEVPLNTSQVQRVIEQIISK